MEWCIGWGQNSVAEDSWFIFSLSKNVYFYEKHESIIDTTYSIKNIDTTYPIRNIDTMYSIKIDITYSIKNIDYISKSTSYRNYTYDFFAI